MLGIVIRAIEAQRTPICKRWEVLLCGRPYSSALGHPEILSYKIPEICDEVFEQLHYYRPIGHSELKEPVCPCGQNPMQEFYAMGEVAMTEGMLRAIRSVPDLSMANRRRSLEILHQVLHHLRVKEINLLCSVCQMQPAGAATHAPCYFSASARSR